MTFGYLVVALGPRRRASICHGKALLHLVRVPLPYLMRPHEGIVVVFAFHCLDTWVVQPFYIQSALHCSAADVAYVFEAVSTYAYLAFHCLR